MAGFGMRRKLPKRIGWMIFRRSGSIPNEAASRGFAALGAHVAFGSKCAIAGLMRCHQGGSGWHARWLLFLEREEILRGLYD